MAQYGQARELLRQGEFARADAELKRLAQVAPQPFMRAMAMEIGWLAHSWNDQGLVLVREAGMRDCVSLARDRNLRTGDELGVLYTTAVFYGLGTGGALAAFTEPKSPAGAILPALGLAGASAGVVALLDSGRGLGYGVPQSISTGLAIGLEEGIVLTAWNQARTSSENEWSAKTNASVIWGLSTAGAVAGGVLGTVRGTTPGRASFVNSAALWSGFITGTFAGGVAKNDNYADDTALLTAAIGLNAGAVLGTIFAGDVSPSISRVRYLDLGGISGSLLFGGLYFAAAGENVSGQKLLVASSLGAAAGLVVSWIATGSMEPDRGAVVLPRSDTSLVRDVHWQVLPAKEGVTVGLSGTLF
jgi:hypothetical protein